MSCSSKITLRKRKSSVFIWQTLFHGTQFIMSRSIGAALTELGTGRRPSVILLDLHLPDTKGSRWLQARVRRCARVPGHHPPQLQRKRTAASAVRAGAQGLPDQAREVNAALLHRAILYAMERQRARAGADQGRVSYALAVARCQRPHMGLGDGQRQRLLFAALERARQPAGTVRSTATVDWFDAMHPEDIARVAAHRFGKPSAERQHFEHDRLRHEGSDPIWVYARGVILTNAAQARKCVWPGLSAQHRQAQGKTS